MQWYKRKIWFCCLLLVQVILPLYAWCGNGGNEKILPGLQPADSAYIIRHQFHLEKKLVGPGRKQRKAISRVLGADRVRFLTRCFDCKKIEPLLIARSGDYWIVNYRDVARSTSVRTVILKLHKSRVVAGNLYYTTSYEDINHLVDEYRHTQRTWRPIRPFVY